MSERIQDKMYSTIYGSICFRRLNATHMTGCGSALGGSNGVLHLIETPSDFDFVINKPPAPPYTLIIPPALFTRENILNIKTNAAQNVAGIVLIDNRNTTFDSFSHESKCPNQYGGLLKDQTCDVNNASTAWNPFGTGLMHENYPFPIFYVKDTEHINQMIDCYHKFNQFDRDNQHRRSLCSIQIKSFMSAAVNSVVCMRRTKHLNVYANMNPQRYCDPLQGKNVYATLFPRDIVKLPAPAPKSNEDIIVVAARIDTTSMFDGVGLGAMDSLVPTIALISTAHTLVKMLPDNSNSRNFNILFILFNGESYDYIGSQRFVYDMEKGDFPAASTQTQPIKLENIKLLIDIGSLDNLSSVSIYQKQNFFLAKDFTDAIAKSNSRLKLNIDTESKVSSNVPPTSSQTFLRDNESFPAMIFYSDSNKNRFYHSIYDDEKNLQFKYYNTSKDFTTLGDRSAPTNFPSDSIQMHLTNFATLMAHSLHQLINANPYNDPNAGANPYLIDELLECYLESTKCRLFRASLEDANTNTGNSAPPQRYISVHGSHSFKTAVWTYRVLGFLTGRRQDVVENKCAPLPLAWFAGINGTGECLQTTQNLSDAYSPAFTDENYDWSSGRYSTWTESTWSEINARIFLKPSVSHEALSLAIGFVVMVISFVFVFLVNSKSDVLFGDSTSSVNALTLPSQC